MRIQKISISCFVLKDELISDHLININQYFKEGKIKL
ncbi:hypothetical protein EDC17_10225 [Sphingobacterium alimentarium]|uniref:Uncharacterized protein n=1 Tax=Sphingobacterium alimentarium TaxID=797292 RepID=A0A4R3VSP0_9SPHI|nr:hypothetical protein EDC17_10225 [Sphingobacterium alimentarium]